MARPDAVVVLPGREVVHLNDLKATAAGARIEVAKALGGSPSDTIVIQNLGKKGIRVHLGTGGMTSGYATVRGGEDMTLHVALDEFFVTGVGDSFDVTLIGRP